MKSLVILMLLIILFFQMEESYSQRADDSSYVNQFHISKKIIENGRILEFGSDDYHDYNGDTQPFFPEVQVIQIPKDSINEYFRSGVYTFGGLVLFSYVDECSLYVSNSMGTTLWTGVLNQDDYKYLSTTGGVYQINGTKRYSVIAGKPSTGAVGYFTLNGLSKPLSKKLLTYTCNAASNSSLTFALWSYYDNTNISLINLDADTVCWSGNLNKGEHYSFRSLHNMYLKIESDNFVSAQIVEDGGFFVPSVENKFCGKEFFTYSNNSFYRLRTILISYYDDNNVEIRETNGNLIWQGILNDGEVTSQSIYDKYIQIISNKNITVCSAPFDNYGGSYWHLMEVKGKNGSGIDSLFYVPCINNGRMNLISYQDETEITITNMNSGNVVAQQTLSSNQDYQFSTQFSIYKVESSKRISIFESSGSSVCGADFATLLFNVQPDFSISIEPSSAIIQTGQKATFSISIDPIEGFSDTVHLSISPTFNDINPNFSDKSIIPSMNSTLELKTTNNVESGIYKFIITGTTPTISHADTIILNIVPSINAFIYPFADSVQIAGEEFWLDINVGTESQPVSNLFGVSFVLYYDTTYAEVVSPYSNNVIPGDFLGSTDQLIFYSPELSGDSVNVGITRKRGNTNVSGYGTVARIKFRTSPDTPAGTQICFRLSSVTATDSAWNPIELTPRDTCVTIQSQAVIVWPGDTNNDGIVNIADVLPLGPSWELTGSTRPNASTDWIGQPCPTWTVERATYADGNGDGIVTESDIQPIGLNWGRTHSLAKSIFPPMVVSEGSGRICPILDIQEQGDNEFYIDIQVDNVHDLFGVAFQLQYPQDLFDIVSVKPGERWSSNRLFYHHINYSDGSLSLAISQIAGRTGLEGTFKVARITMKTKSEFDNKDLKFDLTQVAANNSSGEPLLINADQAIYKNNFASLPKKFSLYQNYPNPFNSATKIKYELPEPGNVEIKIYNALGNEIAVLVNENKDAGEYTCVWDGRDRFGEEISSGIYFYKITTKSFADIKKCIFMK